MNTTLPTRRSLIHFAATMGRRYQMDGAAVCRLLRLAARWRRKIDQGAEYDRLTKAIEDMFENPRRPEILYSEDQIFVGDVEIP